MSKFTGGYRRPMPGGRAYDSLVLEEEELNEELGSDSIGNLGLSTKVLRALRRKGGDFRRISYLKELLKTDRGRALLRGVPGISKKTLAEIERQVAAHQPPRKSLWDRLRFRP